MSRPALLAPVALAGLMAAAPCPPRPLLQSTSGEVVLRWGRVALTGPTRPRVLESERGSTLLDHALRAGERRELLVPFALSRAGALSDSAPRGVTEEEDDGLAWRGWRERSLDRDDGEEPRRDPAPRPPADEVVPRAGGAALAVAAAGALLALALRRRSAPALGVAALATWAAWWLAARAGSAELAAVRVLEGAVGETTWARLDVAPELAVRPGGDGAFALELERARVSLRAGPDEDTWLVRAGAGRVVRADRFPSGLRMLAAVGNAWGDLSEVWTRDAAGRWVERGPWPLAAPLPAVRSPGGEGGGGPPGWLAAGCPPGAGVLVARLAEGAWSGPEEGAGPPLGRGRGAPRVWLRLRGFDAAESGADH